MKQRTLKLRSKLLSGHYDMPGGLDNQTGTEAAQFIATLGDVFASIHQEDIALQADICVLVSNSESALQHTKDLQHVDLITQFHANMSRLLPVLAKQLEKNEFSREALLEELNLQSLKDCFEQDGERSISDNAGELTFL